jgi:hypothetical protein
MSTAVQKIQGLSTEAAKAPPSVGMTLVWGELEKRTVNRSCHRIVGYGAK